MKGTTPNTQRITLYVKSEHRDLLSWVRERTDAESLSEAIFSALADYKQIVTQERRQRLEATHGIWRDHPEVEDAFDELQKGWATWQDRVETS